MRRIAFTLGLLTASLNLMGQQYPQQPYPYPQQQQYPQPQYPQQQYPQQPQNPQQQDAQDTDQPGPAVARLSIINGDVSVRRGDSGDWVAAVLNAPLMVGDSISVAAGGRAEVQLDAANFVRVAGDTEVRVSDLGAGRNQLQMSKGLITYRTLRDTTIQSEISTPAVSVHPLRMATVRVEIAPDGTTRISTRRGEVEASTPRGVEHVREGSMMMVRASQQGDEPEYQVTYAAQRDSWDGFNDQRDAFLLQAQSNRYVNPDITGTEDMESYGRWGQDPQYGDVWTPNVPAGWAPYRDGQWVWEDFYGWTWVDASPWGWAPFHYGSWYQRAGFGWTWFPGRRTGHYWYHPAMVGFIGFGGGGGVGFGFGNVGWIPLAPFEIYHPWYGRGFGGRAAFGGSVNIIHNTNIFNTYRNAGTGGVTAVSGADFQRGQFRNQVSMGRAELGQAALVRGGGPVAPTSNNLRFTDRAVSGAGPRGEMGNQRFYSRSGQSGSIAQRTPFAQQQAAVRSSFGASGYRSQGTYAPQAGGGQGNSRWQRFGEPTQSGAPARNGATGSGYAAGSPNGGWDRFGSTPQRAGSAPGSPQGGAGQGVPGQGYGASRSAGPARPLQVAPPLVRQREAAPSYNRGGGGSAPANRSAPSAPRGGGGGGGRPAGGARGRGDH